MSDVARALDRTPRADIAGAYVAERQRRAAGRRDVRHPHATPGGRAELTASPPTRAGAGTVTRVVGG